MWLRRLQPRFSGEALQTIKLLPWRGPRGDLAKWSGLKEPDEPGGSPRMILDREAPTKDKGQLEVRWTTEPEQLAKGSVQYRVTVMAGDEDLAEQTLVHKDRPPQRAVFGLRTLRISIPTPSSRHLSRFQLFRRRASKLSGVRRSSSSSSVGQPARRRRPRDKSSAPSPRAQYLSPPVHCLMRQLSTVICRLAL
jgi:hypothetical protein